MKQILLWASAICLTVLISLWLWTKTSMREPSSLTTLLESSPTSQTDLPGPPSRDSQALDPRIREILAAANTGQTQRALELAEKVLSEQKDSQEVLAWTEQNLARLLLDHGRLLAELNRCDEAIPYLDSSFERQASAEAALTLAICHKQLGELTESLERMEWMEKRGLLRTQSLEFYLSLLDTMGAGEHTEELLRKFGKHLSQNDQKKHHARLKEIQKQDRLLVNGLVLVYRPDLHDKLAQLLPPVLDEARTDLQSLGFREPEHNVQIILHPKESFGKLNPHSPAWAGAIFDGRVKIAVAKQWIGLDTIPEELRQHVRHELVHAYLRSMAGRRSLPYWFEEGLAQWFACGRLGCQTLAGRQTLIQGQFLPPQAFVQAFVTADRLQAGSLYRQSLFLVETLVNEHGSEALSQILNHVNHTQSIDSDSLLAQFEPKFEALVDKARLMWDTQGAL